MTVENIIEILKILGYIILGGLTLYFKSSEYAQKILAKIKSAAPSTIAQAEQEYASATKAGGAKMAWAVNRLYVYVPKWLQPFISRDTVEQIVQFIFDGIETYAKTQLDRLAGKVAE